MLPLQPFAYSRLGGSGELLGAPRAAGKVLRGVSGALQGLLLGVPKGPQAVWESSVAAFSGPAIILEAGCGVAGMIHPG